MLFGSLFGATTKRNRSGELAWRIHPALMIVDAFQRKDANLDLNMAVSIPYWRLMTWGRSYGNQILRFGVATYYRIILHRSNENKPTIIVSNFGSRISLQSTANGCLIGSKT